MIQAGHSARHISDARMMLLSGKPNSNASAFTDAAGGFRVHPHRLGKYHIYLIRGFRDATNPDYLGRHESDFPVPRVIDGPNPPLLLKLKK
jgi:hypothetical protein